MKNVGEIPEKGEKGDILFTWWGRGGMSIFGEIKFLKREGGDSRTILRRGGKGKKKVVVGRLLRATKHQSKARWLGRRGKRKEYRLRCTGKLGVGRGGGCKSL